jgi:glycolate oxidase subunit GlcD
VSGSSDTAELQRGGTEAPGASEPGPPVSLSAKLLADLRRVLGEDAVLTEPARLLPYESDGMPLYRGYPAAVLLPRDTESVTAAIRLLHAAAVPWVARGAGTGLSGGATAPAAGVIIGLARLREALEIDTRARRARVEAGVINLELNREVKPFGLMFAPDPSSEMACTIGGNVATNAGGPHTLKYGVTSQHLLGARVILGDGTPLELGGAEETMAGYDLVGLLCGSEGTFGLVTEATVRLCPLPEATRTFLVAFERVADASRAVTALLLEGILPAALEMIDSVVLDALEEAFGAGFPLDAGALLIGEVDGLEDSVDVQLEAVARVFKAAGGRELRLARTAAESAALWMARKKTFGALGRVSPNYLSHDAVIPRTALPAVLQRISEVARKWDLRIANVFHAGDGNLHPAVLFDEADPELLRRAQAAGREILHVCIAAGGVITGEHGIGVSKRESMRGVFTDAESRLLDQLRHIFDPWNEVNPGKVLPRIPPQDADDPAGASTVGECDPSEAQADRKAEDHEIEISEALHRAWAERKLLAPVGAGTLMVAPPTGETLPTGGMERIVRYDPGDMAVTVDPGVRLAVLEEQLAREGQRLAWEAPDPESATIGGIVHGRTHWLRRASGQEREWLRPRAASRRFPRHPGRLHATDPAHLSVAGATGDGGDRGNLHGPTADLRPFA